MKFKWRVVAGIGLALAALSLAAADPTLARSRHKARAQCIDRPHQFTLLGLFTNGRPVPNGCAPAAYAYGEYVGQDPDANVRMLLQRDPESGYAYGLAH